MYVNGEQVRDVTAHPAFRGVLATLAALQDAQFDPAWQDVLTCIDPATGERIARGHVPAHGWEEMRARLRCDHLRADMTFGLMGRLTDYMSVAPRPDRCAGLPWCIDPQSGRSRTDAPDETVHVVERRDDGVIVRGARLLSTLAPIANEVYVGAFAPRKPEETDKALIFSIPAATPGLKIMCREPYDAGRSVFDRPLSSRFDEGDGLLVFDDVFIPNGRLFVDGDVEVYNSSLATFPGYTMIQAVTRSAAKLRLILGVATLAARATGRLAMPRYQEILGEMMANVNVAEGLQQATALEVVARLEAQAEGCPLAVAAMPGEPAIQPLVGFASMVTFFPAAARSGLDGLRTIAGSGAIAFSEADYLNDNVRPLVERYFIGANMRAHDRLQIMKLVWDLTGEQFGSRQALYERYYTGDPIRNLINQANSPKRAEAEAMAGRLLAPELLLQS